jgi:arabinogalactan oligomer/maltooligosaccharide transport system substrate-binding protein
VTSTSLPTDPLDFAALRIKAEAFKTATGKPLICNQGFPGSDAYHVAPVYFGFGVPNYIDELGNVHVNTPEAIHAGTWLSTMPLLSPASQTYADCQSQLLAGEVGMWWTGPWALSALNVPGFSYGIVPMGKPYVGTRAYFITTNGLARNNAAVALDMIQYLTNFANAKAISLVNLTIPANKAAFNDPEVQAIPSIAGFRPGIASGIPMSPSRYIACQWGPLSDAETAIWNGTSTSTDALNLAQQEIEGCVSSMKPHIYLPMVVR